jgi:phospholipid transport system transporter-binding protein
MYNVPFQPSNELTFYTAPENIEALIVFLNRLNTDKLHLDLSAVTLCDSAGLALLIEAKRLCRQKNKTLIIQNMPKAINALAVFCGVSDIIETHSELNSVYG